MGLDAVFLNNVAPLYVPVMGTELVAPLLYDLVRMIRPRMALEVGMGYTTPFLAQGLVDARRETERHAAVSAAKSLRALEGSEFAREHLEEDPAFASPAFYGTPYDPRLFVIDDFSVERSSANVVAPVLEALEIDHVVTQVSGSLADAQGALGPDFEPFDFVWIDAWAALHFFEYCWDLVASDGGLVAFHYLVGYDEGDAIVEYMKATQQLHVGELEILSLIEPHKLEQNNVTLVRRLAPDEGASP